MANGNKIRKRYKKRKEETFTKAQVEKHKGNEQNAEEGDKRMVQSQVYSVRDNR